MLSYSDIHQLKMTKMSNLGFIVFSCLLSFILVYLHVYLFVKLIILQFFSLKIDTMLCSRGSRFVYAQVLWSSQIWSTGFNRRDDG